MRLLENPITYTSNFREKMIWHITKRELYDHLNSLRFALVTVLLLGLMLTNAVVHLREDPERIQRYRDAVTESLNVLKYRANNSLYELAQKGPGYLYKKPSALRFCAEGGEDFLPGALRGRHLVWESMGVKSFWRLTYPSITLNLRNIRPAVTKVDWHFIIGYILSLVALLFTFDSLSGERESGTLRLTLANPVPRHTLLIGKFLGALISINIPFTVATLVNLLVISTSSDVHLSAEAWGRLSIIWVIAILYISLFLSLGMLVSARAQQSAVSLVILLFVWATFVIFMPNTLASIASRFSPASMSYDELQQRRARLRHELEEKYQFRSSTSLETPSKRMQLVSDLVTKEAEQQEYLNQEYVNRQIRQVQHARSVTCISPVTILQHLLESFAGTGFERHLHFLENAQRYVLEYRQFVIETDRADPKSLHFIGLPEGSTQNPVSPEAIPKFEDTISLTRDLNTSAVEFLLLLLFLIVLLSGMYLAFVRVEV